MPSKVRLILGWTVTFIKFVYILHIIRTLLRILVTHCLIMAHFCRENLGINRLDNCSSSICWQVVSDDYFPLTMSPGIMLYWAPSHKFNVYFNKRLLRLLSCIELFITVTSMAPQITGVSMVCTTVCSGADKKTNQSSVSLAFVRGPVTSEFPSQRASNAENVSIWWRHHVLVLALEVIVHAPEKWLIIGSGNVLSPDRHQAIIETIADLSSATPHWIIFTQTFCQNLDVFILENAIEFVVFNAAAIFV